MKFFNSKFNLKFISSILGVAFFLFLGSTQFTHAMDIFSLGSISSTVISSAAFAIAYVIAFIFGIFIAIESWLIGIVLNINANILQTSLVQTGFSISLSVANLAFVLGIIVIAIATILRSQTYGIKQLLWKLVVMAILVNFGLVIMSPIFALGNSFTQYFLNCINPGAGGCTQNASGLTSFNNFGTTLAAAFNPANPFTAPSTVTSTATLQSSQLAGAFNPSSGGAALGQAVVPLFGIIFVAIDLILIVVILGGFIALLTVRYLYIAILAILLPFAWAAWVFPSFSSHWKKWWDLFLRWTFFAPIVLFFIYLALLTMKGVGATGVFDVTSASSSYTSGNTTWTAISAFLTGAISPVITSFLQEILLGGLIVGGMIAANSMGIKLAGTMVKLGEKGGNAVKGAAWNGIKRRTSDRVRTMGRKSDGKETTTTMQRLGSRLQNVPVPGFKGVGSKIATAGAPAAFHEERKGDIEKYLKTNLKGLDNKGLISRANSSTAFLNPTEAAAIGQELAKRDLISSPDLKAGRTKDFLEVSEKMGNVQSILNNRPELAAQTSAANRKTDPATGAFTETVAQAISRAIGDAVKKIKVSDAAEINHKSMGDPTKPFPTQEQQFVTLNTSTAQLRKLAMDGSSEQSKAAKDTITKMMTALNTPGVTSTLTPAEITKLKALESYTKNSPEWQYI